MDYLQEARVAFLRSGPASALLEHGVVVVGHQVEYRRPISYAQEPVAIELGLVSVGGSRLEIAYEVRQAGELAAVAGTVLCAFDFGRQAPARLSHEQREFFAAHPAEAAALRVVESPQLAGRGTAVPIKVRWSDLDSYAHVNNAVVFDYVQQARVMATTTWDPGMARAGAPGSERVWLVARQDVDYLAQISHRMAPYEARVAPVSMGSSSITLATELIDPADGRVFVRARTVLVSAGLDLRPAPLTQETRDRLGRHLVAE